MKQIVLYRFIKLSRFSLHMSLMLALVLSFSVFGQVAVGPAKKNIKVILGIDTIEKLSFAPHTKIQVGNDSILSYVLIPQKREITLKGLKPGSTSVTIRDTVGDIRAQYLVSVTATSQSKVVQELKELLGDVEGLEIGVKGELVFVGGELVVPNDIGKVVIVLDKYPDVLRFMELSPHTRREIAKKMQEEIQKSQMKGVTVRIVNSRFWLEGVVDADGKKAHAEQIAAAYLPDNIETLARRTGSVQQLGANISIIRNFIQVNAKSSPPPVPKMIKITAQFVELTKDYNRVFGFKWTPTLGGSGGQIAFGKTTSGGVTTKSNGTLSGTISNLFPKLASARSAGHARIIQSGVVLTKENEAASIVKNSSKRFSVGTGEFTKSETSVAGFKFNVTPKILPGEKIDLSMSVNVSSNIGDPPEKLSNQITSKVVIKSKETAVIGGIVINKTSTDFDRDPVGGTDTVDQETGTSLFTFLRSKSYLSSRSQFVVFVTPELIESASAGTSEIQKKFRKRRR